MALLVIDPALQWTLRLAAALLFLTSAHHKVRDPTAFRAALSAYQLLPRRAEAAAAAALAGVEISIGFTLLAPGLGPAPVLAGVALLATYSGAIAINLARGRRDIDCGCAGRALRRQLSGALLIRNAVLIGLVALCALPAASRPLIWLDGLTIAAGVGTLTLLYAAIETAATNESQLRVPRVG